MKVKSAYVRKGRNGRVRAVIVTEDGRYVSRTLASTDELGARRELAEWRSRVEAGADPRGCAESPVACEYAESMVERLYESGSIEASTEADYRKSLRRLRQALGDVRLSGLTAGVAQACVSSLLASGLSSSSVNKACALLSQTCREAIRDGLMDSSPMDSVRHPKRRADRSVVNYLPEEGRELLKEMLSRWAVTPLTVAIRIAMYAGLREGEVCALRWEDAKLRRGLVWVRSAVGQGRGGSYVKGTKSDRPRDVYLPREATGPMAELYRLQGMPSGTSYLMTGTDRHYEPSKLCKSWRVIAETLGLVGSEGRRVTFHDLRHTWATVAVASKEIDIKTISSALGHASAAMTLDVYAGSSSRAKEAAAEVMGREI